MGLALSGNVETRRRRAKLAFYGAAYAAGFALAVLLAWLVPEVRLVLVAAPIMHFVFGRRFSVQGLLQLAIELLLTFAALAVAAALR